MLNLQNKIKLTQDIIDSPNLIDKFTSTDLGSIGEYVYSSYNADVESRKPWLRRTSAAMDLAMQIQKDKDFPWPGCSNVAFPLITIATLQFSSRAYPALIEGPDIVQMRVIGQDPDGSKTEKAFRVSEYMSWQLMEQDETWEEQEDRALIHVPVVGTAWKKSYYAADKGRNSSDLVLARDLVLNYWAKSVEDCPVKTHIIPMDRNKVYTRIMEGIFQDVRREDWYLGDAPQPPISEESTEVDNRSGLIPPTPNESTPFIMLEQHCNLDLDKDGYAEPYIVTIEESTHTVMRIVCRFDNESDIQRNSKGQIITIKGDEYFTKIPFIPNPDGSIMDLGFGVFLGPLNESVNSAVNQLFDAATLSNTAGGFLGRGAKIRGGVYNFNPFEWNRIDSTGDDIRKSLIPLPVREPNPVMFNLLSLLINYTEKISGAVDISTGGNPGQNTPATTSQTMVEQGQKVYAAIFKRMWRSLKQEFKKLYILNGKYLPVDNISFAGGNTYISRADFLGDPSAIVPVADPNILSDTARFAQAKVLMDVAKNNPLYDPDEVNIRFLKALRIKDIDKIYLGTKRALPPQTPEKLQIAQMQGQVQLERLKWEKLQYISSLLEQRRLNEAKIIALYAQAALYEEQAGGENAGTDIMKFRAQIDALKFMNENIKQHTQQLGASNVSSNNQQQAPTEGTPGNGQGNVLGLEKSSSNGPTNEMGGT